MSNYHKIIEAIKQLKKVDREPPIYIERFAGAHLLKISYFEKLSIGQAFRSSYGEWYWKRTDVIAEMQNTRQMVNMYAEELVYII